MVIHCKTDSMEMTTTRLSKEAVAFMKSEGRYEETLANICDRLFAELKECRKKTAKIGDQSSPALTA